MSRARPDDPLADYCEAAIEGLLPPGPLADAVEEWTEHVATAKKEEQR